MNAQVYYGLNIAWGLGQTAYAIAGVTGQYQSSDQELKLDENEVRDQLGNVVAWTGYNPTEGLTLEYIANDGSAASGSAAITYPDRGAKISVTGAAPVAGSGWIVQSTTIKRVNTDVAKVSIKANRYLAIT